MKIDWNERKIMVFWGVLFFVAEGLFCCFCLLVPILFEYMTFTSPAVMVLYKFVIGEKLTAIVVTVVSCLVFFAIGCIEGFFVQEKNYTVFKREDAFRCYFITLGWYHLAGVFVLLLGLLTVDLHGP